MSGRLRSPPTYMTTLLPSIGTEFQLMSGRLRSPPTYRTTLLPSIGTEFQLMSGRLRSPPTYRTTLLFLLDIFETILNLNVSIKETVYDIYEFAICTKYASRKDKIQHKWTTDKQGNQKHLAKIGN